MRWSRVGLLLIALGGIGAAFPSVSRAQTTTSPNQLQASPKGAIGFGLIGAELGLGVPALIGLDQVWVYCVAPPVAAAGFAIMGHYLVDQRDIPSLAVASLALGIALVIPTVIVTISALRYDPDEAFDVPDDGEAPREEDAAVRARRLARAGDGLFRFSEEGLLLGLPGVAPVPRLAEGPLAALGPAGPTEIRFSLVTGVF